MKRYYQHKHDQMNRSVDQLKRLGYSVGIGVVMLSMLLVLIFGSPTFSLSPATATFDYIVYPVIILAGSFFIFLFLRGRTPMAYYEKPFVGIFVLFFVGKFGLTLLSAPNLLPLSFIESWYWMMIGVWVVSFLALPFSQALPINIGVYGAAIVTSLIHIWLRATPESLTEHLLNFTTSSLRLSFVLALVIVLGYVKHQWVLVEREALTLRNIAHLDTLTQLPNRRLLNNTLVSALARHPGEVTVILFDLDSFKRVNDEYGHAVGDDVLQEVANLVRSAVGESDTVGRWGGEEFLVIRPEASLKESTELAERLRSLIANHPFTTAGTITSSFGVAQHRWGEAPLSLFDRVDEALYAAKGRGKNAVQTAVNSEALNT